MLLIEAQVLKVVAVRFVSGGALDVASGCMLANRTERATQYVMAGAVVKGD